MYNWASCTTPSNSGPGTYESVKPTRKKNQSKNPFTFGSSFNPNPIPGKDAPPVGNYNPQDKIQHEVPKYSFSKSKRVIFDISKNPSPTAYSHMETWTLKEKMPSRIVPPRPDHKIFTSLSNPNKIEEGIRNTSFIPSRGSEWLGPGTYNQYQFENKFHPKYTLSIEKSRPISSMNTHTKNDDPGPGSYDIICRSTKIPHCFGEYSQNEVKQHKEKSHFYSGPTPWAFAAAEKSSAFKSKSERFPKQPVDDNPGPGAYFAAQQSSKLPIKSFSTLPTTIHSPLQFSAMVTPGNTSRTIPYRNILVRSTSTSLDLENENKFSVITRTLNGERRISLNNREENEYLMVESEAQTIRRPRLVQKSDLE
ncbi:hypothetical protein TVAG_156950 [Trichomonas vaginalis G3]|uniref:Uncharacterized protein n=1 Tax=Trichomonas vaginalis (strain ATCC PRA-98 / G3) TaxID=412133 RepID=A2FM32_TRIV3|nr:sperm-tail PG-rich repeat-containing protein [Trichomonas vaginalis G3]EAX94034.1 hypothetical protein TVAG_156950 [Trichomonas vaginalis G3]KAI5494517.1 sperm-tail PG-rich repeat-containing protein [Trichomonas vaginalis G3]|eukprot:XP_001306964.1 hypothetical protein [Trichomonas vaginalis G3]